MKGTVEKEPMRLLRRVSSPQQPFPYWGGTWHAGSATPLSSKLGGKRAETRRKIKLRMNEKACLIHQPWRCVPWRSPWESFRKAVAGPSKRMLPTPSSLLCYNGSQIPLNRQEDAKAIGLYHSDAIFVGGCSLCSRGRRPVQH